MRLDLSVQDKIRRRQELYQVIRQFFAQRGVAEVETPILEPAPNPSPFLTPIYCQNGGTCSFLQSSPEFYMKRLLAAGSGDIFQICKAFRAEEQGRWHRPEFSILEWYRLGLTLEQLEREVVALVQQLWPASGTSDTVGCCQRYSYGELFERYLRLNPYTASVEQLQTVAERLQLVTTAPLASGVQFSETPRGAAQDRASLLELLFTLVIEPHFQQELASHQLILVTDFPVEQAMLARIANRPQPHGVSCPVAARFELYGGGVELANGFWELNDPAEQRRRFEQDLVLRRQLGLAADQLPLPEAFLQAVAQLPDCAGVAVGLDRLLALAVGADDLEEILLF